PIIERGDISGELHAGRAGGQKAVGGGQDDCAVFVAGEIVALRFDAQHVTGRASGGNVYQVVEGTGQLSLDEGSRGIFKAAVPIAAGRNPHGRTDKVGGSVESGDRGFGKLVGKERVGSPESDVIAGAGALDGVGGDVDAAVGHVVVRSNSTIRPVEVVESG